MATTKCDNQNYQNIDDCTSIIHARPCTVEEIYSNWGQLVRPEDVDIVKAEDGMVSGKVTSITFKGVHYEIIVEIKGFKWMIQTTDYQEVGSTIGLVIEPDAIHIMKKSEYSGLYGDYSSFSEEFDELSDATIYEDEEE